MTLAVILIIGLATHRVVSIWSSDEITKRPREWAMGTWLAPLAKCPFCLSVWGGAALTLLWLYGGRLGAVPSLIFAVSGVAVFLEYGLRIAVSESNRPVFPRMTKGL